MVSTNKSLYNKSFLCDIQLREFQKKYIFTISVTKPTMEAFKLPIIGTLFCYAKNGIKFFETPDNQLFF